MVDAIQQARARQANAGSRQRREAATAEAGLRINGADDELAQAELQAEPLEAQRAKTRRE